MKKTKLKKKLRESEDQNFELSRALLKAHMRLMNKNRRDPRQIAARRYKTAAEMRVIDDRWVEDAPAPAVGRMQEALRKVADKIGDITRVAMENKPIPSEIAALADAGRAASGCAVRFAALDREGQRREAAYVGAVLAEAGHRDEGENAAMGALMTDLDAAQGKAEALEAEVAALGVKLRYWEKLGKDACLALSVDDTSLLLPTIEALRCSRESFPVPVRFDCTAEGLSDFILDDNDDPLLSIIQARSILNYLATRAVLDVPPGVPSVEELDRIGQEVWRAATGTLEECGIARATAIRDAVLAGVAAEVNELKAENTRLTDKCLKWLNGHNRLTKERDELKADVDSFTAINEKHVEGVKHMAAALGVEPGVDLVALVEGLKTELDVWKHKHKQALTWLAAQNPSLYDDLVDAVTGDPAAQGKPREAAETQPTPPDTAPTAPLATKPAPKTEDTYRCPLHPDQMTTMHVVTVGGEYRRVCPLCPPPDLAAVVAARAALQTTTQPDTKPEVPATAGVPTPEDDDDWEELNHGPKTE